LLRGEGSDSKISQKKKQLVQPRIMRVCAPLIPNQLRKAESFS
jgi:hypothetical protein